MNDMLGRLEAGARSQREFVSAASHELRTPIAVIRHVLDVARRAPAPDWDDVAENVLEEDLRMQRLVDDLLVIARTDSAARGARESWSLVDLDDLVFDEVQRVPAGKSVDLSRVSAGQVFGDEDELRRIVRNLLDNALRHAADSVAVEVTGADDQVVLAVEDDGPGIEPEDRDRIFERFVRLDDARSRRDGGFGLGLAIVSELVREHEGTIDASASQRLGGARLAVSLPDARQHAAAERA